MTKLILCRHGETEYNLQELCTGQSDISLTSKGKSQADALGQALKGYGADLILCSTLYRARQTAAEIHKYLRCEIEYHDQLREQCFGEFEGRRIEDYFAAAGKSNVSFEDFRAVGGESFNDLRKRVKPFIADVAKRFSGETVVIITHGSVIRAIISNFSDMKPDQVLPGSFIVVDLPAS